MLICELISISGFFFGSVVILYIMLCDCTEVHNYGAEYIVSC